VKKPHLMAAPLSQQAFSFVSDDEAQEMAKVYEQQQQRRVVQLSRISTLPQISIEVLNGPIFTKNGEKFLEQLSKQNRPQSEFEFVFNREPTEADKAEDVDAILRNLDLFVAGFMDTILEGLADIGGVDDKLDTLEWMFAGDNVAMQNHYLGKTKIIAMKKFPFSFSWCCRCLGLCPDNMREGIEQVLKKLQLSRNTRISNGKLSANRRDAVTSAVDFIKNRKERS